MTLEELDLKMYPINDEFVEDIRAIKGDFLILGAGGKMGPSLSRLTKLAIDAAKVKRKVIAVSRFSNKVAEAHLHDQGIETISMDLMDDDALQQLPEVENVIYMAGTKFGTTGNESHTWGMNAYLPGRVAEKFKHSRVVAFSTGNVYPLTPVSSKGPTEEHQVAPIGEYAQSCLGRERMFEFFSKKNGTPVLIYRLNYAIDFRYGVLLEIAKAVQNQKPIDLSMGHVNIIWQGDANQVAIRSLKLCSSPPTVLNVTGSNILSVRSIATEFGNIFGMKPLFVNEEQPTALLSNAAKMEKLFPFKKVSVTEMITMTAAWLQLGGSQLDKPTHFQERSGKF
jgi:nucleoside-diphosphate-sugar epimerase